MTYTFDRFVPVKRCCLVGLLVGLTFMSLNIMLSKRAFAQEETVTGTVLYNPELGECFKEVPCTRAAEMTKEENWVPPEGAVNIAIKGTDSVLKTDPEGHYEASVASEEDTLMFMYIGHNRVAVPVNGRSEVNVKLTPTPLPVIDRLLGLIMPQVVAGQHPDIDELANEADVNRETARDILWLVLGTRRFAQSYSDEYIPDYSFPSGE